MTDINKPKSGSLAFRPRKRAKSQVPSIGDWRETADPIPLGLAGYKVGMTHLAYIYDSEGPNKGKEVVVPATVIEVPPIYVYGLRIYRDKNTLADVLTSDNNLLKKLSIKSPKAVKDVEVQESDEIFILVSLSPDKTGIGKKHPEKMEIKIGGKGKTAYEKAKELLGKELDPSTVLRPGSYVDVISITKGKGWQGPVKRFGVSLQRPKATGKRRHVGTLGQWHPAYILYTVPRAGQTGYHKRTELNKRILYVGKKPEEINPKSGFPHYGFVKNNYILLKGSVPGPVKRLIRFRLSVRQQDSPEPKITYISNQTRV